MTNHVHLIVTPAGPESLAKAIGRTHWLYTQYVNRLHGRSGHLWQNRFYSCALDEGHFWLATAYVERNPVRARLVRRPWRCPSSSAAAHCGKADKTSLLEVDAWGGPAGRRGLARGADRSAGRSRRRPLGSGRFLAKLERALGRCLHPLPVGRPRKRKGKGESR